MYKPSPICPQDVIDLFPSNGEDRRKVYWTVLSKVIMRNHIKVPLLQLPIGCKGWERWWECLSSVSSVGMLGSAITDHIASRRRRPNSTTINAATASPTLPLPQSTTAYKWPVLISSGRYSQQYLVVTDIIKNHWHPIYQPIFKLFQNLSIWIFRL